MHQDLSIKISTTFKFLIAEMITSLQRVHCILSYSEKTYYLYYMSYYLYFILREFQQRNFIQSGDKLNETCHLTNTLSSQRQKNEALKSRWFSKTEVREIIIHRILTKISLTWSRLLSYSSLSHTPHSSCLLGLIWSPLHFTDLLEVTLD